MKINKQYISLEELLILWEILESNATERKICRIITLLFPNKHTSNKTITKLYYHLKIISN